MISEQIVLDATAQQLVIDSHCDNIAFVCPTGNAAAVYIGDKNSQTFLIPENNIIVLPFKSTQDVYFLGTVADIIDCMVF